MYSSNKKTKPTVAKQLNSNLPTYERTLDIVIPPKINKDIKSDEIFETAKNKSTKNKNVKKKTTKKKTTKKKSTKKY
tara:strand:- start:1243 stop:1473 length:231 start_codon:yes stop_codon:yes gene_type:complete